MMASTKRSSRGGRDPVLTPRRRRMVQFIEEYLHEHGCSPTNREIADAAGLASVSSVSYHLQAPKAAEIVAYEDGRPRTVRVLRPAQPAGVTGEASGRTGAAAG